MTNLSSKERFGRLGPVADASRSRSGSSVVLSLNLDLPVTGFKSVSAVEILTRNGMSLLSAKRAIERVIETGQTTLVVPMVPDRSLLAKSLEALGLSIKAVAERRIAARQVREKLGLTQEQFALRFGIDVETLRNWEQGKRQPDRTAESYLRAIEKMPDAVQAAQAEPITDDWDWLDKVAGPLDAGFAEAASGPISEQHRPGLDVFD